MINISVKNITLMETPETDEALELYNAQKRKLLVFQIIFGIIITILNYVIVLNIFIDKALWLFLFCGITEALLLLVYFTYIKSITRTHKKLLKIAMENDRIRHEERIRYRERKRLEETEPIVKPVKLQLPMKPISKEQK